LAAVFSTVGFPLAFGFAGAAGAIAARAARFSSDLAGRVRFVVVGPALRAALSLTALVAFVLPETAGFARRSSLMALAGLVTSGFAGLLAFAVGLVVVCAALPAVDLVGGLTLATLDTLATLATLATLDTLATLATLDTLFGVALMADFPVSV
jgi:hypothetical protein